MLQRLKPVARRDAQRIEPRRGMQLRELSPGHLMQRGRQPAHVLARKHAGGVLVRKGLDHNVILTLPVINGKRYQVLVILTGGSAGNLSPQKQ